MRTGYNVYHSFLTRRRCSAITLLVAVVLSGCGHMPQAGRTAAAFGIGALGAAAVVGAAYARPVYYPQPVYVRPVYLAPLSPYGGGRVPVWW